MDWLVLTGAVVRRDLELNLLAVRERAEARSVDLRLVDEDVTLLAIDSDEAEALGRVEPFAGAGARGANIDHLNRLRGDRRPERAAQHEAGGGGVEAQDCCEHVGRRAPSS